MKDRKIYVPLAHVLNASQEKLYLLQNDRNLDPLHRLYARSLIAEKTKNDRALQSVHSGYVRYPGEEAQFLAKLVSLRMANRSRRHSPETIKELLATAKSHVDWWPEMFDVISANYMLVENHQKVRLYAKFALFHFDRCLIHTRMLAAEYKLLHASSNIYRNVCYFEKFVNLYERAKKADDTRVMAGCLLRASQIMQQLNRHDRALTYSNKAVRRFVECALGEYDFFDALCLRAELLMENKKCQEAYQDIEVLEKCRFARINSRTEHLLERMRRIAQNRTDGVVEVTKTKINLPIIHGRQKARVRQVNVAPVVVAQPVHSAATDTEMTQKTIVANKTKYMQFAMGADGELKEMPESEAARGRFADVFDKNNGAA